MASRKIGRNAGSGKFTSVAKARKNKRTHVVETITTNKKKKRKK